jgi:hypothetical protein
MRFAAVLCLSAAFGFAASWSGALVDSKCYESEQLNVNPSDTLTSVDRDNSREIRFCSPGAKTKYFTVVQRDGLKSFKLDSAENAKAADLVRNTGKKSLIVVDVTGEINRNTIKVDSISLAR